MEKIEMRYIFKDDNDEIKEVSLGKKDQADGGLRDYEICEMFVDFMRSAGFSEDNIVKYFRE